MNGIPEESNILAKTILAEVFDTTTDQIKNDASIDSIDDWDSLAHVQVITRLEEIIRQNN